jgi:hypothetical protein
MALYAMFLVTVGVPLLAVGVDVARVKYTGLQLANATQAACQAYANSLDIKTFRETKELKFTNGYWNAYNNVFRRMMPGTATFFPAEIRRSDAGIDKIEIVCMGSADIRPIIPLVGNYHVSASASAKTKFSTQPH